MLIIADDYTGAADAAAALATRGLSAMILLDGQVSGVGCDVVALDLDTRHRTADEARQSVLAALAGARSERVVFKKIDSTLRGQIGAELHALSTVIRDRAAPMLVAPAVPENDRIVRNGRVFVRGVPLEETDVWRHECATFDGPLPARMSERLAQSGLRTEEIHLDTLREGPQALRRRLEKLRSAGVDAVILDTETTADLAIIAQTAASFETMPVCVGAAGLARSLGNLMMQGNTVAQPVRKGVEKPVLMAIASQSKTARAQVACAALRADVAAIAIEGSVESCAARAAGLLENGSHVLLCPPEAKQQGLSRNHAATMARVVARVADRAGALIASGGDTARACLQSLGYDRIIVEGELAPGVVQGNPVARPDLTFVSKAGDFGETDTLSACIDKLTLASQGTDK